jgi:hypothetical protein
LDAEPIQGQIATERIQFMRERKKMESLQSVKRRGHKETPRVGELKDEEEGV